MAEKGTSHLPEGYCLWEMEETEFRLGLLGSGPGFLSILDIMSNPAIAEFLPPMTLVALAEPGSETAKLLDPRVRDIPVYATYEEMLARHPDINMLVELSGKRYRIKKIVAQLPDGVSFIDHTASFILCALNKFAAISATCRTNLDNQRALLEAVVNEVPEDIVVLDRQGHVADCNRNVMVRLGKTKEVLLGRPCWEVQAVRDDLPFCHPETKDCPFYTALRTGQKAEALETRVNKEGRLLYFRVYAYPVRDALGQIAHVLVMRRDITSRTEGEKRLQQSEKIGIVGRMSQYLAHEIRNPLFAIGGFTNSLLRSENLTPREREKVKIILEETARLDAILREILGFTKPGEGVVGEVDAVAVAREAVAALQGLYMPQDSSLTFEAEESLPWVRADADTLKRGIIHLIDNAYEAMGRPGAVIVRVFLNQGDVCVSVGDTGRGMPKDVLERVFSPFFSTKGGKGTGLGLAKLRKDMDDWGGSVEVASQEGKGTTVTLRLAAVLGVPATVIPGG